MLSQKHYERIAGILQTNANIAYGFLAWEVIDELADYFKEIDPNFDWEKFIVATHPLPEVE